MPFKFTPTDAIKTIKDAFNLAINQTGFGTTAVEVQTNQIDVNASFPANSGAIRLVTGGTVDEFNGEFDTVSEFSDKPAYYQISTNGNDGDFIGVESAEEGRYIPGYESIAASSFNVAEPLDENHVVRAGYGLINESDGSVDDGFYVEIKDNERSLVLRKGGETSLKLDATVWDNDPFATGELDEFTPSVFRMFFNWYGAGNIRSVFSYTDDEHEQNNPVIDKLADPDEFLTNEINLRMFVLIKCQGNSDSGQSVNSGSMEYKIRGTGSGIDRLKTSHEFNVTGGNIDGSLTGIKVLRIDPNIKSIVCALGGMEVTPDSDMQVAAIAVDKSQLDVADADFGTPNLLSSTNNIIQEAPFSAIDQANIPATVDEMNGARQISGLGLESGSKGSNESKGVDVEQFFTRKEYVVFVAKTDGTAGADVNLQYNMIEEF